VVERRTVEKGRDDMALIWVGNIEDLTEDNSTFRTVLWTGAHSELTVMSIAPGEEIGVEVHPNTDQFLRIEEGHGQVKVGPTEGNLTEAHDVKDGWAFIVPAGTWHNVINTGKKPLKLYTVYSPANHAPGTVHKTKADAVSAESAAP
jgi:mannose-6-phosphate isomerase-like protein (cupin superfamily)